MGKKNRGASKRQQSQHSTLVSVKETKEGKQQGSPGNKKTMLNMLLLLVVVLPFVFSWEVMEPLVTIRYALLSGFALLFVVYFYGFRKKLITMGWPLLAKIAFLLGIAYGCWNMISLFSAINKQEVYYGLSRHFLNMLILFIVTQIASQEENYLLQLCKLLSVAAIIHSLIGVCQFYDIAFNDLPGNYKPYGLMGNRNLFGTGQVMLLPFSIFVLYKGSRFWKYLAALALLGIAASAILSQTRSSWLAGTATVIVSLILILLFSPENRKKWLVGTITFFATVVVITLLLIKTDTEGQFSESIRERTGNIFSAKDSLDKSGAADNVSERLKIWSKTKELIRDNLLTGVGPGNWRIVVAKYGSEGLAWSKGKYIPDSPHNDYLLVIAESGIPGALLYIGMWVVIALIAFKTIVKPLTEERRVLNILMLSGLVAFAVDSMFSFPAERIEHTLYVYLMAGIILGTFINSRTDTAVKKQQIKKWQLAVFIAVAAFNLFLSQKKYSFEKHLALSKSYEAGGAYQQAIEQGNKGKNSFASIPPDGIPIEGYMGLAYQRLKNYPAALKEMDAAISIHPYNKALYINKGTVYTEMGQYDKAISYYNRALKLTPDYDIIFFNLAMNYFRLKDYKACLETLKKVDIGSNQQVMAMKQQAEYQLTLQKK